MQWHLQGSKPASLVMRTLGSAVLLGTAVMALSTSSALAADSTPATREAAFAEGGLVILDANVGDVQVMPAAAGGKLQVSIQTHSPEDAKAAPGWIHEFAVNGSQAKIVVQFPKRRNYNMEVVLRVPQRSDLKVHMDVGDLKIDGVTGNVEADLGVGDLKVTVPDPKAYRTVSMSVRIGDVNAKAFNLQPSGFLGKSVDKQLDSGSYRLKLHTGIGDVSCVAGGQV